MTTTDTYQLSDVHTPRDAIVSDPGRSTAAELRATHLAAGRLVAALDLGDTALWARLDADVAGISAEAYAVAAALSRQPPRHCATRVPPVVRVRELAAAQSALFIQLDRAGVEPLRAAAHGSAGRVRALCRRLPHPAGTPLPPRMAAARDTHVGPAG